MSGETPLTPVLVLALLQLEQGGGGGKNGKGVSFGGGDGGDDGGDDDDYFGEGDEGDDDGDDGFLRRGVVTEVGLCLRPVEILDLRVRLLQDETFSQGLAVDVYSAIGPC